MIILANGVIKYHKLWKVKYVKFAEHIVNFDQI